VILVALLKRSTGVAFGQTLGSGGRKRNKGTVEAAEVRGAEARRPHIPSHIRPERLSGAALRALRPRRFTDPIRPYQNRGATLPATPHARRTLWQPEKLCDSGRSDRRSRRLRPVAAAGRPRGVGDSFVWRRKEEGAPAPAPLITRRVQYQGITGDHPRLRCSDPIPLC
jgi:hypothetical protein